MKEKNKQYLLDLARRAIQKYLLEKEKLEIDDENLDEEIKEKRGVFVTLTKNNQLRGCIGNLLPIKSIYQAVIDNSLASAFLDNRFFPVQLEELDEMKIEISILSPLKKLPNFSSKKDFLNYLKQKRPGLYFEYQNKGATFLPQVWEELNDPREFLSHLFLKAGFKSDEWEKLKIWENPQFDLFEYYVISFQEK